MRAIISLVAVLTALAGSAIAADCQNGIKYCGGQLERIDKNYKWMAIQNLYDRGKPIVNWQKTLFKCIYNDAAKAGLIDFHAEADEYNVCVHSPSSVNQQDYFAYPSTAQDVKSKDPKNVFFWGS